MNRGLFSWAAQKNEKKIWRVEGACCVRSRKSVGFPTPNGSEEFLHQNKSAMAPSVKDCLECKCTNKQTQEVINMLAKKAEHARSLPLQDRYMQQMMKLADCMENAPGPLSAKSPKQAKLTSASRAKWVFVFVLSLGVTAAAWPALAYMFGKLMPSEADTEADQKPLWASGAIAALLLGVLTFVIVRLLL
jgi:hypothetical protein